MVVRQERQNWSSLNIMKRYGSMGYYEWPAQIPGTMVMSQPRLTLRIMSKPL